jgi:glycosyltransferase involved in cell wall biosynthesis
MRIALILPGFSADAGDWCIPALRHLVQALAQTDEVHVLALRYPYTAGQYQLFGAQVTALGGARRRGWGSVGVWRRALGALLSAHRRHRFHLLHAFWANETGAVSALAGRVMRIPTVVSLAGGELVGLRDIRYGGQLALTERLKVHLALRLADGVTAGSQSLFRRAAPWLEHHPVQRRRRIPLGVDLRLFRPGPVAIRAGKPYTLVHAASLVAVKDQSVLLQAVEQLHRCGLNLRLEIAGAGLQEMDLRALADRLGLSGIVRFRGAIPHHRLPALYNRGTIFVLSSRFEAQCMAVLEAAACGRPIVGTGVGVVPELAPDAAVAVPTRDPDALASAVEGILRDPDRQVAMGQTARSRVEEEFGLNQCVERFRRFYKALIGST